MPASRVDEIVNAREHLLLWVHVGRARVTVAGDRYEAVAGQAVLVPPGVPHSVETDEDSVAFPILFAAPDADSLPASTTILAVPQGWEDWLIWQFARGLGYVREPPTEAAWVRELVEELQPAEEVLDRGVLAPPMPRSPEAFEVARIVLTSPSADLSLPALAARATISPRTLQRRFAAETGLSFGQWRTRARIAAAVRHLRQGRGVGWTGQAVGFHTAASFARAFRDQMGTSPSDFLKALPSRHAGGSGEVLARTANVLARRAAEVGAPPPIPATSTWDRINDFHVGVWVYRGTAVARVGGREMSLTQGDGLWLPAGVRNHVEIPENSLVLPVAWRSALGVEQASPQPVRFAPEAERYLLHVCVATYSLLQPRPFDGAAVVDALRSREQVAEDGPAIQRLTAAVQRDPADNRSLDEWAAQLGVEPQVLRDEFVAATGERFSHWRGKLRMSVARQLLDHGEAPSNVARRLGYAHLSGFSRLFNDAYGMSPRRYQQRQRR